MCWVNVAEKEKTEVLAQLCIDTSQNEPVQVDFPML